MITISTMSALLVSIFSLFIVAKTSPTVTGNNTTIFNVLDGGVKTIYCDDQGIPNALVSWEVDGNKLSEKNVILNFIVSKNGSLIISNPLWNSRCGSVNVTCITNSTAGNTSRTLYQVMLLKAPRILTNSSKIAIIEHTLSVLYILCETTGCPKPVVEWEFGDETLNASHGLLTGNRDYYIVLNGQTVIIKSSYQVFNNGTLRIGYPFATFLVPHENFTCVARNIAGKDSQTHDFYIGKLKTYSFEVVLKKRELLSNLEEIVRQKIGKVFQPGKLYYSENITSVDLTSGAVHFQLTWMEKKLKKFYGVPRDFAQLARDVLTALEKGGFNPEKFQMNAPPAPPVDLTADEITSDEVTLNWKHPNYFKIEFYQVQISDGSSNKWKNNKRVNGDRNSATVENLDADTKYLIRIKSVNSYGVGKITSKTLLVETKAATPVTIVVVIVILVVVLLLGLALGLVYYRRRKRRDAGEQFIPMDDNPYQVSLPGVASSNIYINGNRTVCPTGISDGSSEHGHFSWIEISRECLAMGKILGQGEFGLVQKAVWRNDKNNSNIPVAVKAIKGFATETDRKELFKELQLMAGVAEHPNIVNLVGACSRGGPLLVVVEFCEHGDLLSYLKKNRKDLSSEERTFISSLEPITRLRLAFDVSKGMCYLEEKKIVHRDLAARNVLLGKNKVAKVSDFGLSRDIYERGLYEKKTGGKLPVKWMAIESLQESLYNSKSDVWSFGVLFWEIETTGLVPYPGIPGLELLQRLQQGYRLPKPSETSSGIYGIMKSCWASCPKERPCFNDIQSVLESYMEEQSNYLPVIIDKDDATNVSYENYKPK